MPTSGRAGEAPAATTPLDGERTMKTGMMLGLGALAVAAVAVAAMPVQDAKAKTRGDEKPAAQAGDPMTEAMLKAAQLGPQHAEFAKTVGTWKARVKNWNDPTQPPTESEGTTRYELALGGRYLVEHFSGEMPGMGPFDGMGIFAFNNITGEYQHVWMDSFSTGIFMSSGKPDADGTCEMTGEMDNPLGGDKLPCRMIMKEVSENERHFEMHGSMGGPEMMKMMEIDYTRAATTR
jgi:hypothetical protein